MQNWPVARFRELRRRPDETWQGKMIRLPSWVTGEGDKPFRPSLPLWLAVCDDKVNVPNAIHPRDATLDGMVSSLFSFALEDKYGGYRPGRIVVTDTALAEHLQRLLVHCEVEVQLVDNMPELAAVEEGMRQNCLRGTRRVPSLLAADVTLDHVRRFAEAAAEFYRAMPWLHLCDVDLIRIHTPKAPPDMRFAIVMGAGRELYGLGFYGKAEDHYRMRRGQFDPTTESRWQLSFGSITELPIDDVDLWEDHSLPVGGADAYPTIAKFAAREILRPSADELVFLEGLLVALANTTEKQIDSGRWHEMVGRFGREVKYTLSIPDLLRPPLLQEWIHRGFSPDRRVHEQMFVAVERFFEAHPASSVEEMNAVMQERFVGKRIDEVADSPETPAEIAQGLCYQALDTFGRRRVQLVRQALQINAECVEAHVILAEQSATLESQLEHYQEAVAAGERALGGEAFREHEGHFWDITSTRPYMRARLGLAQTLEMVGRIDEALAHYQQILQLNPADNQGARYLLLPRLLEANRDVEAAKLLKAYDERSANWTYARALLAYRLSGASPASRKELQEAFAVNPFVPEALASRTPPPLTDHYSCGSREEAASCATDLVPALEATPGSSAWITGEYRRWRRDRHQQRRDRPRADRKKKNRR